MAADARIPLGIKLPAAEEHYVVWLVWTLLEDGRIYLRAVDNTREWADRHRQAFLSEPREPVRAWIEARITNHAYGAEDLWRSANPIKQLGGQDG